MEFLPLQSESAIPPASDGEKLRPLPAGRCAVNRQTPLFIGRVAVAVLSGFVALFSYRYVIGVGFTPANMSAAHTPCTSAACDSSGLRVCSSTDLNLLHVLHVSCSFFCCSAANKYFSGWMMCHMVGSATALLLGPAQFVPSLRRRYPVTHRWMGRVYAACVALGGLTSLVVAVGVSTGPVAAVGFFLLGLAWMATTVMGVVTARQMRYAAHRRWMVRSFALAFAAVTLRIYLQIAFAAIGFKADVSQAYRAISWLCWVPNLIVAELYLRAPERYTGVATADNAAAAQEAIGTEPASMLK